MTGIGRNTSLVRRVVKGSMWWVQGFQMMDHVLPKKGCCPVHHRRHCALHPCRCWRPRSAPPSSRPPVFLRDISQVDKSGAQWPCLLSASGRQRKIHQSFPLLKFSPFKDCSYMATPPCAFSTVSTIGSCCSFCDPWHGTRVILKTSWWCRPIKHSGKQKFRHT